MANNRTRTAQRRQAETRRKMATSPKGLSREERQGLERSNAASQGVGRFPGTAASKRPTPRPSTAAERAAATQAERVAPRQQSEQDDVLRNGGRGMKAGGKVKKMMNGGKCRGMGAATKGGNYSRG